MEIMVVLSVTSIILGVGFVLRRIINREVPYLVPAGWLSITYAMEDNTFETKIFRRYFDHKNKVHLANNGRIMPLRYWVGRMNNFSRSVLYEYASFSPSNNWYDGLSISINRRDYQLQPLVR